MTRVIEVHNGISAILAERSDYDALWVSSLTHSASVGLPDNEIIPLKDRVDLVRQVRRVSTKPIIVDIDTGGDIAHLETIVQWFEEAGAYALIMEDKKFPKQNSLLEKGKKDLEDIDIFAEKIAVAKKACKKMKIIARLESLIARKSEYEALLRAEAYIKAGADGIMVHSKTRVQAPEVMSVGKELRKKFKNLLLVAVPTTYELPKKHPFDIVINANHLMRASVRAMERYLSGEKTILASVKEIFNCIGI